jgi:hypothetical protein
VPDAIIATGRSDYPNQVNNVLCFPFIFRGALDVGATTINDEMEIACIDGIAALARATTTSAEAAAAYQGEQMTFGRDYLIPKPFDPTADRRRRRAPWRRPRCALGRGDAAHRGFRGLQAQARRVGLPIGADHAAGLRGGGDGGAQDRLRRRRGRTCPARRQAMIEETTDSRSSSAGPR